MFTIALFTFAHHCSPYCDIAPDNPIWETETDTTSGEEEEDNDEEADESFKLADHIDNSCIGRQCVNIVARLLTSIFINCF